MKKPKRKKRSLLFFFIINFLLIFGHAGLIVLSRNIKQILYSIIPLTLVVIQFSRITYRGVEYKGWYNGEIKQTIPIFIIIGVALPYFGYNILTETGILFWIGVISFVIFVIYMSIHLRKIIQLKLSFVDSKYNLLDLEKSFQKQDTNFEEITKKENQSSNLESKLLYLPEFDCKIYKIKDEVIIQPTKRKAKNNVFSIIDMIED